jgi:hypothetical protein
MEEKNNLSGTEKRLETLAIDTEKQKKALVDQLRKTPIIQLTCERLGIGRSTYYRWRLKDHIFGRASDEAIEAGRFLVNDIAESRLLKLLQEDNLTAIIFWLKHNHPKYATVNRLIHEYIPMRDRLSLEEEHNIAETMARMSARKNGDGNFTGDDVREEIEETERNAETNREDDEKLEGYNKE